MCAIHVPLLRPPISLHPTPTQRAAIPLLNKRGINGLSFGAGTPPGKPDTPPLFLWRDLASGAEVVTTYETAYGTASTVFVLPNGVALAAAWNGDNTGPGPSDNLKSDYDMLRKRFPGAKIMSSTFDDFFEVANQPEVKALLPVVTAEIEDVCACCSILRDLNLTISNTT